MGGYDKNDLVVLPVGTTGNGSNAVQGGTATTTVKGDPPTSLVTEGASSGTKHIM